MPFFVCGTGNSEDGRWYTRVNGRRDSVFIQINKKGLNLRPDQYYLPANTYLSFSRIKTNSIFFVNSFYGDL